MQPNLKRIYPGLSIESGEDLIRIMMGNASDRGWRASVWGTVAHFTFNNPNRTNPVYNVAFRYNPADWYARGVERSYNSLLQGGPAYTANNSWANPARQTAFWKAVYVRLAEYRADPNAFVAGKRAPPVVAMSATAQRGLQILQQNGITVTYTGLDAQGNPQFKEAGEKGKRNIPKKGRTEGGARHGTQ